MNKKTCRIIYLALFAVALYFNYAGKELPIAGLIIIYFLSPFTIALQSLDYHFSLEKFYLFKSSSGETPVIYFVFSLFAGYFFWFWIIPKVSKNIRKIFY